MKFKLILLFFSVLFLSGFIFAGTPGSAIPSSSIVFEVDIVIPNPYFGLIVADASNLANPNSVNNASIQNNAVTLSKIYASLPGAGKYLRINSAGNALEWAAVDGNGSGGGGGTGEGIVYTASTPIFISNNVIGLSDFGVTSSKLANNSVTSDKLSENSVTTIKLNNSAVTNTKISDGAVNKSKIAVKSVDHARLEVYPLDKCPANNATIIYRNNRLEWSDTVECGSSASVTGNILPTRTENYYPSPFNSCVKSVTHTVTGTSCTGAACLETWSLSRSGGSYSDTQTVNGISGNRTFTFNASENDLYNSTYDIEYSLAQPSTGMSDTRFRNNNPTVSKVGCNPSVPSLTTSFNKNASQCILSLDVSTDAKCIGNCQYTLYLNGNIYRQGTFSGYNGISENIHISDLTPNTALQIKVVNLSPTEISGLETSSPIKSVAVQNPSGCPAS